MKKVLSVIIWIASKITGRKNLGKLLVYSAKSINVNLHLHGLIQIGGVSSFNSQINGEKFNKVGRGNKEIGSVNKEVFHEIFKKDDVITSIEFKMDTIDNFCKINNISNIDFLKIDVEGHELSVLKGAQYMLTNKHIKIIQFEFNSHNVYSRVFLRDFYLMLKDY